jgi:CheY-like chemotaxis protein
MNAPEPAEWVLLLVDDDEDNLDIAEQTFEMYGAVVHLAKNGQEALAIIHREKLTFALVDLSMPIMDGWELIKRVQAEPRTAHLPLIALTAHAMVGDEERVMAAGFSGYVSKPFIIESLIDTIKKCLSATPTPAPAPPSANLPNPDKNEGVAGA